MRRPAILSAAFSLALACAPARAADAETTKEEYQLSKKKVQSAEDTVRQFEKRVDRAGSTYERLQAQRQLEMARKALRDAKRDFEGVKLRMKPGDRAFEEDTRFEGRELSDDRPSGPGVPFVIYSEAEPTRGGSTGEVVYNMRRNPNQGAETRMDPGRWKVREKEESPIEATPGGPAFPAAKRQEVARESPAAPGRPTREQYVLTPGKLGGGTRRTQGGPLGEVDFVGDPAPFDFVPFDDPGEPRRGRTQRETAEETALIESVKRRMEAGEDAAAQEEVERLLRLRADDARVHHLVALVYLRRKMYAEAEWAAKNALRIGMEHPAVYESLALAQLAQGREKDALMNAEKALRFDPSRSLAASLRDQARRRLTARGEPADAPSSGSAPAAPVFGGLPSSGSSSGAPSPGSSMSVPAVPMDSAAPPAGLSPAAMAGIAVFSVLCAGGGFLLLRRGG